MHHLLSNVDNCKCIIIAAWVMVIGQKTKEVATISGMLLLDARRRFVLSSCHGNICMKRACNDACHECMVK